MKNYNILKNIIIIYIEVDHFELVIFSCYNFSQKIESYKCVRVPRGRKIYNQLERVQNSDQNGEKIKVLAASNQKLQMRGISKGRRHSRRDGAKKNKF